ncbi:uncharacterized protein LOC129260748 isoform X2 [Lytechinus pictus]|uniref:uncharacterized protein LOC129260748 isoform X2 n=1 Tax=Lytechinus pictus TaxID=7653 RepID=UPI0030B9E8A1
MAARPLDALSAVDVEKDAGMTDPGTSSCIKGLGALCLMFDSHIAQLDKLKETALRTEQDLGSKVTRLEQKNREQDEKIRRLEQENILLKGNCHISNGEKDQQHTSRSDETIDWKKKYEEMRKECEKLKGELRLINSMRNSGSLCNSEAGAKQDEISAEEESPVTMDHQLYISEKVPASDFKHILRHLSVNDTDVKNIYNENRDDAKECIIQGLEKWRKIKGTKATVGALVQGLLKGHQRDVAEEFCEKNNLHQLQKKIGLSNATGNEEVDFPGSDFTAAPVCPSDRPLHITVWTHLIHPTPTSLEELDQELSECDLFTSDQLKQITKRKFFQNDSEREEFLRVCGDGNVIVVLHELVRRLSSRNETDQSTVMMDLGKLLRKLGRKDIRSVLITYLQSGVIGPSIDEKVYYRDRDLCYRTRNEIGHQLSERQPNDFHDWRCFASDVGFSQQISKFERSSNPGSEVLKTWGTSNEATIGRLYGWAVKEQRWDIVKIMEKDMSNLGI